MVLHRLLSPPQIFCYFVHFGNVWNGGWTRLSYRGPSEWMGSYCDLGRLYGSPFVQLFCHCRFAPNHVCGHSIKGAWKDSFLVANTFKMANYDLGLHQILCAYELMQTWNSQDANIALWINLRFGRCQGYRPTSGSWGHLPISFTLWNSHWSHRAMTQYTVGYVQTRYSRILITHWPYPCTR